MHSSSRLLWLERKETEGEERGSSQPATKEAVASTPAHQIGHDRWWTVREGRAAAKNWADGSGSGGVVVAGGEGRARGAQPTN